MSDYERSIDALDNALSGIQGSLETTEDISRAFRGEMETLTSSMVLATRQTQGLSKSVGSSLKTAFDDLIVDGKALSDVMGSLGRNIASRTFNKAVTPVANALGGAVESGVAGLMSNFLKFADGGVFSGGKVHPFASGGVVNSATSFPMKDGMGLMGEAGPEAIMPLSRGADGKLGVRGGGGGVRVTMNISTPDVEGFRKSRSQIATDLSRAITRSQRNL